MRAVAERLYTGFGCFSQQKLILPRCDLGFGTLNFELVANDLRGITA